MQHRIDDDQTADDAARTAHTVARNVEDKFQALKDDVDLLKAEIRSTLVDLRESMTKDHTIKPQAQVTAQETGASNGSSANGSNSTPSPVLAKKSSPAPTKDQSPGGDDSEYNPQVRESMDTVKMGNIIWWLGMVKGRGLTEQQIRPFLEAYEESGHLKPAMAKLTYRSLTHLEAVDESIPEQTFTAEQYSDCLLQLHNIICTPGYVIAEATNVPVKKPKAMMESPVKPKTRKPSRPKKVTHSSAARDTGGSGNPGQTI